MAKIRIMTHFTEESSLRVAYRHRRHNALVRQKDLKCALLPRWQLAGCAHRSRDSQSVRIVADYRRQAIEHLAVSAASAGVLRHREATSLSSILG
jgi:hypothetical protein